MLLGGLVGSGDLVANLILIIFKNIYALATLRGLIFAKIYFREFREY